MGVWFMTGFFGGPGMKSNEKLRVASTFHGLSAIAAQVSPVKVPPGGQLAGLQNRGITSIEANAYTLTCFHSPTGLKIFILSPLGPGGLKGEIEPRLKEVHEAYSDYVLKNPFYEPDQPIRCELFDERMDQLFQDCRVGVVRNNQGFRNMLGGISAFIRR
mmetsp:Transcript_11014/g.27784  ORF Transcript_11014/g.27784 Transcript_11014/m.27784 type:complete len:160 (+) Transcript_11014:87-566(+)